MKINTTERINKHGKDLKRFFNLNKNIDPAKLSKSLRRLENKAHAITTKECNEGATEQTTKELNIILNKVNDILNFRTQGIKVFINGDARGYALKIDSDNKKLKEDFYFYKDWGGYGIIAPDLNQNEN